MMTKQEVERRLIKVFFELCNRIGYDEANALFDKHGLNGDIVHDDSDVDLASSLLDQVVGEVTA